MKRIISAFTFCIALFTAAGAFAAFEGKAVKRANQLYGDKKYDAAKERYERVLQKMPDSSIANFGLGAVFYKKAEYDKAVDGFAKSMLTDDASLEAKANYNAGNCKYRQGRLKADTDLDAAIGLYREALENYKRAMELDPEDKDAKYNYEFVERELKLLSDRAKQEKEKEKKEGNEKQSEDKEEGGEEKEAKEDAGQNQEQKKDEPEAGDDQRESEQNKTGKGSNESPDASAEEKKEAGGQGEKEEMSEEEARMLLEGYRQEEEAKGKVRMNVPSLSSPEVLKDW